MGWMWLWWLLILLGLVAVVVGLGLALRSRRSPAGQVDGGGGSPARNILDERYARGEIDEEEYRRRRRMLDEQ